METISCLVGIQYLDDRVEYIYVNWEGHVKGVGSVLHNYYRKREAVLGLIMTGSRNGLHPQDLTEDGETLPDMDVYKSAKVCSNEKEYFEMTHAKYPIRFYYLFTADSTWTVHSPFGEDIVSFMLDERSDYSEKPAHTATNTRALFTYFGSFC